MIIPKQIIVNDEIDPEHPEETYEHAHELIRKEHYLYWMCLKNMRQFTSLYFHRNMFCQLFGICFSSTPNVVFIRERNIRVYTTKNTVKKKRLKTTTWFFFPE